MMRHRRLGRPGLSVPECTLGTSVPTTPDVLALALERGVTAIELDAADGERVGELLRGVGARHDLQVYARVTSLIPFDLPSPHVPAYVAYPGHHIRAETEALLRQLGVERLALQQLHAWCPEWLDEGDWLETLGCLRQEGKIAGFGVSLFDHDSASGFTAVASGTIDSVQVMVNLFDQGAAAALLPLCRQHDVAVVARSPLYYGALASHPFAPEGWRDGYFYPEHRRETTERVERLARETEGSLSDLALRFALSHPAVSTVAVGMRTPAQVEANLRAFELGPLDPDQVAALARHAWLC
jgi:aryl-alcohol dehydrogenase-like predicted oxidoreductase